MFRDNIWIFSMISAEWCSYKIRVIIYFCVSYIYILFSEICTSLLTITEEEHNYCIPRSAPLTSVNDKVDEPRPYTLTLGLQYTSTSEPQPYTSTFGLQCTTTCEAQLSTNYSFQSIG